MLLAYLSGNIYIFVKCFKYLSKLLQGCGRATSVGIKVLFCTLFAVAASSLFIALFARNVQLPQWMASGMYNVGSIWLVFTLYMVMALLVVDLLKWFIPFLGRSGTPAALGGVVLLLIVGYFNYLNLKVERITLDFSSRTTSTLRIVAVSDVHLGYATGKKALQKYVRKINSLHPDVVLIGGDLIDNSVTPVVGERMWEELEQLEAPYGIYMVPGNHEYISGIDSVMEFVSRTSIVMLRDSAAVLPGGVVIVGRDDRSNRGRKSLAELKLEADSLARLPQMLLSGAPEGVKILLEHQPYEIEAKDSLGFDLQFYGHTHRGQVWPMSLLVDKMYLQSHGYRKWTNSHVIVSSGLSLWGPPFRIGTNSDLWVIDLKLGYSN